MLFILKAYVNSVFYLICNPIHFTHNIIAVASYTELGWAFIDSHIPSSFRIPVF